MDLLDAILFLVKTHFMFCTPAQETFLTLNYLKSYTVYMNNRIFKLHSGWRNREVYIDIYIYIFV